MKVLKAAVVGRSLAHSISPEVHRELFPILQQKCHSEFEAIDYSKIELEEEKQFLSFVESAVKNGFHGINVTFPYKDAAANLDGKKSPGVERIHSANTILCGETPEIISTDGLGFLFSLQQSIEHFDGSHFALTILGAGGAARAVLAAIFHLGWKKITILARSQREAERSFSSYDNISVIPLDGIRRENISRDVKRHFIVQATPIGQRSSESLLPDVAWHPEDIAADLIYNPLITRFLDTACKSGACIVDGLGMLIEQAALSQYFWMTGKESNRSVLSNPEFHGLHRSLSKFVSPTWDAFVI